MLPITRSQINKAGDALVTNPQDAAAAESLEMWRQIHATPLQKVHDFLMNCVGQCTLECDGNVIFSNRLKRSEAIINKLRRFSAMDLTRMQDLAGIRMVLYTSCPPEHELHDVNQIFQHCLANLTEQFRVRDKIFHYIDNPKDSGYRAIHLVVDCDTDNPQFPTLPIELQIRTRHQHLWAMAVETAGMFYNEALKSSEGSEEWLTFFKMCGAAIAHIESGTVTAEYADYTLNDLKNTLKQYASDRTFFTKMANIKAVHDIVLNENWDFAYCIIDLDIRKGKSVVYSFLQDQFESANSLYTRLEQSPACQNGDAYTVLVSVDHLKNIQALYPSYFLDVAEFMRIIQKFVS